MNIKLFFVSFVLLISLLVSACTPSKTQQTQPSASFQQWHSADVFQAFQAAGLPVDIPQLSKDERDLFLAEMPVESTQFVIPAQGDPALARGIVFSFQNERDLQEIQDYYAALGNSLSPYGSWVFIKGNLLLQINRNIPEDVARRYAEALDLLD